VLPAIVPTVPLLMVNHGECPVLRVVNERVSCC
jgi:hypothetical protein